MLNNKEELLKQIGATAKRLGIDSVAVEKDMQILTA